MGPVGTRGGRVDNGTRDAIGARLVAIAEWRRERFRLGMMADQDPRNLRSATGIDELAAYIQALPADDPRLAELRRLAFSGGQFDPGAALLIELGRFRFHDPNVTLDGFVDHMVALARFDANERGQFGGPQIPGDEPWR